MSSEQAIKSSSKKDKKSKRKSLGDAPIPVADPAPAPDASEAIPPTKKSKKRKQEAADADAAVLTEAAAPKKEKKSKGQDTAPTTDPVVVAEAVVSKKEKKSKEKKEKVSAPEPTLVAEAAAPKKEKKSKKKLETPPTPEAAPEEPTPAPAHVPTPKEAKITSISASRKAQSTAKSPKIADKASKKSKKAKAKSPTPEPELPSEEEAEEAGSEEEVHLHGFSTDDDDSSDDEDAMDHEPSAFDIAKLPTVAKDDASVKRKLEKAKRQPTEDRGVIFLGRIPHGFYEDQIRGYFSQFGTVTRVRLSRNKKTGRSKHYGFVEFDSSSVAQIVAETMDNYLLMGHILRCKVIPKDEVHPELWVGANRKWRVVPQDRLTRVEHNKPRTEEEQARAAKRLIKRQNERKRKLADSGIKYDFEAVSYKKAKEIEV